MLCRGVKHFRGICETRKLTCHQTLSFGKGLLRHIFSTRSNRARWLQLLHSLHFCTPLTDPGCYHAFPDGSNVLRGPLTLHEGDVNRGICEVFWSTQIQFRPSTLISSVVNIRRLMLLCLCCFSLAKGESRLLNEDLLPLTQFVMNNCSGICLDHFRDSP